MSTTTPDPVAARLAAIRKMATQITGDGHAEAECRADLGAKGCCPVCDRTVSGRGVGMDVRKVELLRHKNPATGRSCNGTRRVVPALGKDGTDE